MGPYKSKNNNKKGINTGRTIVLSLGGSAIVPESINIEFLKSFRSIILDFTKKGNRAVIVCGGGKTCRLYQKAAEDIMSGQEASKDDLDWIGICATRINAALVKAIFRESAYENIITDPTAHINTDKSIIIASGWKPGFSSDMDAVLLAKQFNAEEVINISNIDYVYDKDPNKYDDTKKIEKISWQDFRKIVGDVWKPGLNMPFDPIASKQAMDLGLKVNIISMDLENISGCINEKDFKGTRIA